MLRCLQEEGVDGGVGVGVERAVERAVGIETRDPAADARRGVADGLDGGKRAADDDLAVGLDGDDVDGIVRLGIELGIGVTVEVEPHEAGTHSRLAAFGVERGEGAAGEHFAVTLEREAEDGGVRAGVVGGVEGAVGVEARDVVAHDGADGAERAADDDLAVGLDHDRGDLRGEAAADIGVERGVEGAVGVETGEVVAVNLVGGAVGLDGGKRTADENLAVALRGGDQDGAVHVGIEAIVGGGALAKQRRGGGGEQEHTGAGERARDGTEKR